MKIDGVKFKQKVLPGDTVVFYLTLDFPDPSGVGQHEGARLCSRRTGL